MKKLVGKWKEMTLFENIQNMLLFVIGSLVIILSILGIFDILPIFFTNSITLPLGGISVLVIGFKFYKTERKLSIFMFAVAAFVLIVSVIVYF